MKKYLPGQKSHRVRFYRQLKPAVSPEFFNLLGQDGKMKVGDRINYAFGYKKMNEADPEFSLKITGTALAKSERFGRLPSRGCPKLWLGRSNTFFMQPMIARKRVSP
jgi:hypothetical protein